MHDNCKRFALPASASLLLAGLEVELIWPVTFRLGLEFARKRVSLRPSVDPGSQGPFLGVMRKVSQVPQISSHPDVLQGIDMLF